MSSFPEEICIAILLRLPVKSTLVCKCVCKNWYALISEPDFVKNHHNLTIQKTDFRLMLSGYDTKTSRKVIFSLSYDPVSLSSDEFHLYGVEIVDWPLGSLDHHEFQIMSSCNGLVCIWIRQKQLFCLWNPVNNEYKELPKPPNKPVVETGPDIFSYAFGYDYKDGDYKLICFYDCLDGSLVEVYTMGLNSWKKTQVIPYYMSQESGVLVNGVYHWLVQRLHDSLAHAIISLDISNKVFKELRLPTEPQCSGNVGVLNQCLSVLAHGVGTVEVWVMQDYGVWESWTRHYTITHESILKQPFGLRRMWSFNSGEILFAILGTPIDLILYDPKDGSARETNIHVSGSDEYNSLRSLSLRDFQYLCGDNARYKNHSS